jgi:hypothetical protein
MTVALSRPEMDGCELSHVLTLPVGREGRVPAVQELDEGGPPPNMRAPARLALLDAP